VQIVAHGCDVRGAAVGPTAGFMAEHARLVRFARF
jgi:hypothetical protein